MCVCLCVENQIIGSLPRPKWSVSIHFVVHGWIYATDWTIELLDGLLLCCCVGDKGGGG